MTSLDDDREMALVDAWEDGLLAGLVIQRDEGKYQIADRKLGRLRWLREDELMGSAAKSLAKSLVGRRPSGGIGGSPIIGLPWSLRSTRAVQRVLGHLKAPAGRRFAETVLSPPRTRFEELLGEQPRNPISVQPASRPPGNTDLENAHHDVQRLQAEYDASLPVHLVVSRPGHPGERRAGAAWSVWLAWIEEHLSLLGLRETALLHDVSDLAPESAEEIVYRLMQEPCHTFCVFHALPDEDAFEVGGRGKVRLDALREAAGPCGVKHIVGCGTLKRQLLLGQRPIRVRYDQIGIPGAAIYLLSFVLAVREALASSCPVTTDDFYDSLDALFGKIDSRMRNANVSAYVAVSVGGRTFSLVGRLSEAGDMLPALHAHSDVDDVVARVALALASSRSPEVLLDLPPEERSLLFDAVSDGSRDLVWVARRSNVRDAAATWIPVRKGYGWTVLYTITREELARAQCPLLCVVTAHRDSAGPFGPLVAKLGRRSELVGVLGYQSVI